MKRLLLSSLLIALPWISHADDPEIYLKATTSCPAYYDIKHTQKADILNVEAGKTYRITELKEGQVLTLIEGNRPILLWIDESCFQKPKTIGYRLVNALNRKSQASQEKSQTKTKQTSPQNLLAVSWQNAFCETHRRVKECKTMQADSFFSSHFTLHGLWPQPKNNQYCQVDKKAIGMDKNRQWNRLEPLTLSETTRSELSQKMSGYRANLHRHEWIKHGSCYGTDADTYYRDALSFLDQFNRSKVQSYFVQNIGKTVYLKEIRKIVDNEFGKGAGDHVTMNCRDGLVTELWLHLGSGSEQLSELLKLGETPKSRCYKGKVDEFGY